MYKSFVSLGRYIPKYFILFVAMVNGIEFPDFYILCPHTLLNHCHHVLKYCNSSQVEALLLPLSLAMPFTHRGQSSF